MRLMVNGRTSGLIRQIVRVFHEGTLAGLSDGEILGRFVDDRDEAAFEALLVRHGPMVLNVCRQILRHPDDAEDAFQATFLALACKAGTLRIGGSLGPWLYRVASRVAARADRRRRGDRERSGGPIPEPGLGRRRSFGPRRDPPHLARGAGSPARTTPGADRTVLPGRDDPRARRESTPMARGDGAQPPGRAPRPARRPARPARDHIVASTATLAAVLSTDAGASPSRPTSPSLSSVRGAARRRDRVSSERLRSLGARRRPTGRSPERVESQAARRLDGGAYCDRGRG